MAKAVKGRKPEGDKPKVVSAFKIDLDLFTDAKEIAYQQRSTYSSMVEDLVKAHVNKHRDLLPKKKK